MKNNNVYLQSILDAIEKIEIWVEGQEFEDFLDDKGLLQSSVIRQLEVIGEAAGRLTKDFTGKHPEIPWTKIIGMRNRLIHEYMSVDLDLTWGVARDELPALKKNIKGILKS